MTPVLTSDWLGKCLDADGNNDNEVELYSCFDAAWQKWDLRGKTLRNRGLGRCLDIKNCPGDSHRNNLLTALLWFHFKCFNLEF